MRSTTVQQSCDELLLRIVQMPLRNLIVARMTELGVETQADLANLLGVHQSQVSRWMNGWGLTDDHARALARWLGVTAGEVQAASYASRERATMSDSEITLQAIQAAQEDLAAVVVSLQAELSALAALGDRRVQISEQRYAEQTRRHAERDASTPGSQP